MKISVVMPAYNSEKFIAEAIESILQQTYTDFEFIIVNDGSTDSTLDIINQYAKADNRIRVITKPNSGVGNTLNRGIEESNHDWIAIMHADDIALPERLEEQVKAVQLNQNVVAWGSYAYHINSTGKIMSVSAAGPTTEEEFQQLRQDGNVVIVLHPTAFLHKETVLKAGCYNSNFDGSEELELFDRMAQYGPIVAISKPLLLYRIHSSSISMNRFFLMRKFTRYVRARQRARLKNEPIGDFKEFIEGYNNASWHIRIRRQSDDLSQFYYRRSGLNFGEGNHLKAVFFFIISSLLNPRYAISRVRQQMFSKSSQKALREIQN